MDKYYQESIFGNKKELTFKSNNHTSIYLCEYDKKLKEKFKTLYDLYEELYNLLNITLFETRENIIIGDIIAHVEDRQAEPIELITYNNFTEIDKVIDIMKKRVEHERHKNIYSN